MPVHLAEHLANGRHLPGILVFSPHMTVGEVVEELLFIANVAFVDEFQDQIIYLPIS